MKISIIIPCKNEELFINTTLSALLREKRNNAEFTEIILVDNCSIDKSISIAKRHNVRIYSCIGNISSVRNYGASKADGDFFCFVDADVEVKEGWGQSIINLIQKTQLPKNSIFGYVYGIPNNHTWVESTWHESLVSRLNSTYINGGNLILHRALFMELNGFSDNRITGEDFDLCSRAIEIGATITLDPSIETIHHGYPKTIFEFYKRERWHGTDSKELNCLFIKSKSSIFAFTTLMLPLIVFNLYVLMNYKLATTILIILYFITLLACAFRLNSFLSWKPLMLNSLFLVYGAARAHSIIDTIKIKKITTRL